MIVSELAATVDPGRTAQVERAAPAVVIQTTTRPLGTILKATRPWNVWPEPLQTPEKAVDFGLRAQANDVEAYELL